MGLDLLEKRRRAHNGSAEGEHDVAARLAREGLPELLRDVVN